MSDTSSAEVGTEMHDFVSRVFPLHRAITGDGVRRTFDEISAITPIDVREVPTGTTVLDWVVPQEWRIRDAYIADPETGERLIDYADSNLHIVNYSRPIRTVLSWEQLEPRLFTVAGHSDRIPYHTAYFRDEWGFCVSEHQKQRLRARGLETFDVVIDSDLFDGTLSYAEADLPGRSERVVLLYAHTCHPSLANDNLSGIAVATFLARALSGRDLRYTYRVVFAPATIGAITWLSRNEKTCERVDFGLVLTQLGDDAPFTYKRPQREGASIDRVARHVLSRRGDGNSIRPFTPFGYDERQFCAPGFDLPVGCLMRTPPGECSRYHTSADDLTFVTGRRLAESLDLCLSMIDVIEGNMTPINCRPMGEPHLSRYGIYRAYGENGEGGEDDDRGRLQEASLWVLNQANGARDLLSIADRAGLPFALVQQAAGLLAEHGLIETATR